jgi:HlyD family secretion protein
MDAVETIESKGESAPPAPAIAARLLDRANADARHAQREKQKRRARRLRQLALGLLTLGALGLVALALRPRPVPVDLTPARRASLTLVIEESGTTRVKNRFVVSAPVSGSASRSSFEPGDRVQEGDALAQIAPLASPLLDERTRAEAEGRLDAARSALGQAKAQVARAVTAREQSEQDLLRTRSLSQSGALAAHALEQAEFLARLRTDEQKSAEFAEKVAKEELRIAQVSLGKGSSGGGRDRYVNVLAPASGVVLKLHQKSAGVVQAGAPLVEVGDPRELEVVVDLLTTDAVNVEPGTVVAISGWGGQDLNGRVSRVEPAGFTRASALGVDEQRVNVLVTFTDHRERWQALGDGYRVEARLVLWRSENTLQVPSGALFRKGDGWAVFRAEGDLARLVEVRVGHRGENAVEISSGLAAGDRVVVHPGERLKDGAKIRPIP